MSKAKLRGYARQRAWHEQKRQLPTRQEAQLGQAIERSGLKVVGWEHEVQEDDGLWCAWYDVAVELKGKTCFIDIDLSKRSTRDRQVMNAKREYCERHDIPLLLIQPGSVVEMQAQIEWWKMVT